MQDPIRRKIKPNPVLEKYFLRMKQCPEEVSPIFSRQLHGDCPGTQA